MNADTTSIPSGMAEKPRRKISVSDALTTYRAAMELRKLYAMPGDASIRRKVIAIRHFGR